MLMLPSDLGPFVHRIFAAESRNLSAETWEQMERGLVTRVFQGTEVNQMTASEIVGITRGRIRDRVTLFQITLEIVVFNRKQFSFEGLSFLIKLT